MKKNFIDILIKQRESMYNTRAGIVKFVQAGPCTAKQIAQEFNISLDTVYLHITSLSTGDIQYIRREKRGKTVYFHAISQLDYQLPEDAYKFDIQKQPDDLANQFVKNLREMPASLMLMAGVNPRVAA